MKCAALLEQGRRHGSHVGRVLHLELMYVCRASKARCFMPSDRERLLAVIETGFGDFKPFNLLVRNYVAAMKGDAVQQVV